MHKRNKALFDKIPDHLTILAAEPEGVGGLYAPVTVTIVLAPKQLEGKYPGIKQGDVLVRYDTKDNYGKNLIMHKPAAHLNDLFLLHAPENGHRSKTSIANLTSSTRSFHLRASLGTAIKTQEKELFNRMTVYQLKDSKIWQSLMVLKGLKDAVKAGKTDVVLEEINASNPLNHSAKALRSQLETVSSQDLGFRLNVAPKTPS